MIDVRALDLAAPEQPVERVELAPPLQLATTRYQNWRPDSGYLPIGITVGRPRFFKADYVAVNALAPHELMKGALRGIDDIAIERKVYFARLQAYEPQILDALHGLAGQYPDTPAVLMCFEKVAELGEDCHRRWYAEWAGKRYGWDIPELPPPAGTAVNRPRKPKPTEAPPTLF
jgi:hypothetical protein